MGKFDEAMAFCRRHQDIAKELGERVGVRPKKISLPDLRTSNVPLYPGPWDRLPGLFCIEIIM